MTNQSKRFQFLGLNLVAIAIVLLTGAVLGASAQSRDPFKKPGYAIQRNSSPSSGGRSGAAATPAVASLPSIEQRIDYYKRLREQAAANGAPLPKVTSVLTLNEMSVTGIFRTPRGYAAMVEAMPIKLSYTIYPGEKFFDGQLVAVEENRLVFRRVTKTGSGKYVSSVENKPLRQYSTKAQIEGTAPVQAGERPTETASAAQPERSEPSATKAEPVKIVSPLDEMNKQAAPDSVQKEKSAKGSKRPVKVAKNKN
jgi:hypothetical protein